MCSGGVFTDQKKVLEVGKTYASSTGEFVPS